MKHYDVILSKIREIFKSECIFLNEPMKNHTTFNVGGNAEILVTPEKYEEIISLLKILKEYDTPYYVFGKGSNILVKDGGLIGVVIKTDNFDEIRFDGENVTVQSGALLKDVAYACMDNQLTGIEFASGIPGTIGGAVTMNAGAYDGEMKNIVESCLVIDDKLQIRRLSLEELQLSYRKSAIQKHGYIALEVVLKLKKGSKDEIKFRIDELTRRREEKQPLDSYSAGSTFKRPEGYYTGKLIQDSNLKGCIIGGAQVSEKHAGFIINRGNAKAEDILRLIKHVQDVIRNNYGVELETEVKIIGEDN